MEKMKAVRIHQQAGPEGLIYEEAPKPSPAPEDALVRVQAAAITPTEFSWHLDWSKPVIPSYEMAGIVTALGATASEVRIGDQVYGLVDFSRDGAAAEYVAVRAADLALKPKSLDYVAAAVMPLSALTAWQALRVHARLQAGQRVLIHGGAGGVGSYAVQLAKWIGAQALATASATNADFVKELGADRVIDYTRSRFEEVVSGVDLVLDTVGGDVLNRSWKVLKPAGMLMSVAEKPPETLTALGVRTLYFIVEPNAGHLTELAALADRGIIRPVVAAVFPLDRARDAYEMGLRGHMRGKIVLRVS
jgi:NADPH:quinone reductase-like Zn-dependent oxidoreductase